MNSKSLLFVCLFFQYLSQAQQAPRTILLDRYFNSEQRPDSTGKPQYWHYTWEERSDPGFYKLGKLFGRYHIKLASLDTAPTTEDLQSASVYIIVDPDNLKDNPNPNYITSKHIEAISSWVNDGGVLLLLANDSSNCDLQHFNQLSAVFGIRFSNKNINMVKNDSFAMGSVLLGTNEHIFRNRKAFMKDISALTLSKPAVQVAGKNGDVIIGMSKFGKGHVIAVGDPWLYNEYIDNGKLPRDFDNEGAARDLVAWLIKVSSKGKW